MEKNKGRKFAYIRVSTEDQSYDRQLQVFKEHGVVIDKDRIIKEKKSGKSLADRDLGKLIEDLEPGDILYATEYSRLARSVRDLLNIIEKVKSKGAGLVSLKEELDTNDNTKEMMITILGAVYEFERKIILERQAEGIRAAKEKGIYTGRQKIIRKDFLFWYEKWKNREVTIQSIAKVFDVSRNTVYRMIRDYESSRGIDKNSKDRVNYDGEKEEQDFQQYLDEVSDNKQ